MFYDARSRRVRKQWQNATENYIYEGAEILMDVENSTGNILRQYTWYPWGIDRLFTMRSGNDTLAALLDPRLGSVRALIKHRTGSIVKDYAEEPWGDAVADTGLMARYRFAGREFDTESGLYYNRARFYDPKLGRFISEDPVGISGGLNTYTYAHNDPVNARDPTGMTPICISGEREYNYTTWEVGPDTIYKTDHYTQWENCHDVSFAVSGPDGKMGGAAIDGSGAGDNTTNGGISPECKAALLNLALSGAFDLPVFMALREARGAWNLGKLLLKTSDPLYRAAGGAWER
jgi:RHS repeat-associated protein